MLHISSVVVSKKMAVYWLFFVILSLQALSLRDRDLFSSYHSDKTKQKINFITILLIIIIGFRYQVGGDWKVYAKLINSMVDAPLGLILRHDIGYYLLSWLGANGLGGIFFVNLIAACVFVLGLRRFALDQSNPFLAILVALPYAVWVVAQGYIRQSMAIGFFLFALSVLKYNRSTYYLSFVLLATLFHRSSFFLLLFGIFPNMRRISASALFIFLLSLVSLIFSLFFLYGDYLSQVIQSYSVDMYFSSGAGVRLSIVGICSLLFILFAARFNMTLYQRWFWKIFSLAGIAVLAAFLIFDKSTIFDRLGLYWLPLQILVLSNLPVFFSPQNGNSRRFVSVLIVLFSACVQWVWLFYADHAYKYLPYKNYLWEYVWSH